MGAGGRDAEAVSRGQLGDRPAETDELVTGLVDRAADLAADLDLALQLLRLDLLLEHDLALFQELLDEGLQLPGFGVDDLVLLFDADRQLGEARLHESAPGWETSQAYPSPPAARASPSARGCSDTVNAAMSRPATTAWRPRVPRAVSWLLVPLLLLGSACGGPNAAPDTEASWPLYGTADVARGEAGMVVSGHGLASDVGAAILANGGNAIDAAVAVGFALAAVLPAAGNVGGGGFLVYRSSDGEVRALDFREKAPAGVTRDMFVDEEGKVSESAVVGHLAAGGSWIRGRSVGDAPAVRIGVLARPAGAGDRAGAGPRSGRGSLAEPRVGGRAAQPLSRQRGPVPGRWRSACAGDAPETAGPRGHSDGDRRGGPRRLLPWFRRRPDRRRDGTGRGPDLASGPAGLRTHLAGRGRRRVSRPHDPLDAAGSLRAV